MQRSEPTPDSPGVLRLFGPARRLHFKGKPDDHREGRPQNPELPEQPFQNEIHSQRAAGVCQTQPGNRLPAGLQLHGRVLLAPGLQRRNRILDVLPLEREPGAHQVLPEPDAAVRGRENVQVLPLLQEQEAVPKPDDEQNRPVFHHPQVVFDQLHERGQPEGRAQQLSSWVFDLFLLDKSLAVMKTALITFLKLEKNLRKVQKIEDFQSLIEMSIKNFTSEEEYKKQMNDFFVNENLYYHLRKMFISIETNKSKRKQSKEKKPSTLFIKDRAGIFGINGVFSVAPDYANNLQPNYFSIQKHKKKRKTTSLKKQDDQIDPSTQTKKNPKLFDRLPSKRKNKKMFFNETVFSLDNFMRESAISQIRQSQVRQANQLHSFSFKNIFKFSSNKEDQTPETGVANAENDLISARETVLDCRARRSNYEYKGQTSLMVNRTMEVNPASPFQEDVPFLTFFFEVSNTEMLEKMERFLVNYLTLSNSQRKTFNESSCRRKSLQSILAILKNSEAKKDELTDGFLVLKESFNRVRSNARNRQGLREKLIETVFRLERQSGEPKRNLHRSLESKTNQSTSSLFVYAFPYFFLKLTFFCKKRILDFFLFNL